MRPAGIRTRGSGVRTVVTVHGLDLSGYSSRPSAHTKTPAIESTGKTGVSTEVGLRANAMVCRKSTKKPSRLSFNGKDYLRLLLLYLKQVITRDHIICKRLIML
jgi:hypothetical protein